MDAFFFLVSCILLIILLVKTIKHKRKLKNAQAEVESAQKKAQQAEARAKELEPLAKYKAVQDADAEAARLRESAAAALQHAKSISEQTIADAKEKAQQISGDAILLRDRIEELKKEEKAIVNRINGYGDEYIVPTYSLMDELAAEMAFTEPGEKLKEIRASVRKLTVSHQAATCDYVEAHRAGVAVVFVTDAFNGKVDSVMSKVKHDNYGKLKQEIEDAYQLVNKNGAAFRNAVIRPEYLQLRLTELKWACAVQELRRQKQEEQREIREKMREEEKARREHERAVKEAQKEKANYEKALEKARAELASANEAKQAEWAQKVADLEQAVKEAEERNQRALSMAQQTKRGNVYIISNVGSFGDGVYKIGMTRRLVPEDRIKELGDASVPFPFDIHALIESDDAPALETELHRVFMRDQINKVNVRKEFYRTPLQAIREYLERKGVKVVWTLEAAATEYRETLKIEEAIRTNPAVRDQWERNMNEAVTADAGVEEVEAV